MNKKINKKICLVFLIILFFIMVVSKVQAKYNYKYSLKAFVLTRKVENTIDNTNKEISNIDLFSPQILGVEDGKTYTNNVQLDYSDNSGIKYVIIKRKNISSESYDNNIDIYNLTQNGEYIIKVSDFSGNICQKNIKIEQ